MSLERHPIRACPNLVWRDAISTDEHTVLRVVNLSYLEKTRMCQLQVLKQEQCDKMDTNYLSAKYALLWAKSLCILPVQT